MKRPILAAAFAVPTALGLTLPVAAQSLTSGFYLRGEAQVEYLFNASPSRDFQAADLSLGIAPGESALDIPLGFDVGLKGFNSGESDLREHVVYGAVGLYTEFGTFWAGAPRPATNGYFPWPRIGGSQAAAAFAGTGITTTDTLALYGRETPIGLRYDYRINDDWQFGASYHDFSDSDAKVAVGLLTWDSGPFAVALGVENSSGVDGAGTDFSGRFAYDASLWGFSAMYSTTSIVDTRTLALDAFYAPRPDVRLTAAWAQFDVEEEDDKVYGVSAEYIFPTNIYLGVGITDSDIADLDASYNAFMGFRFAY